MGETNSNPHVSGIFNSAIEASDNFLVITSGSSAFDGRSLLVSNLQNGVDHYSFPTMEHIGTFPHVIATNLILQVTLISQGSWAIVGGDDGFVRVFDTRTGAFLFPLRHGDGKSFASCRKSPFNNFSSSWALGSNRDSRFLQYFRSSLC